MIIFVMPAYNEEANIEEVVRAWAPVVSKCDEEEGAKLLISDVGSTDRTHEILLSLAADYPFLETFDKCGKQHGPKLMALYKEAVERGADLVFQTDSDGQTDPADFEAFWALRHEYDVILGNRTKRGDGKSRAYVEKVVCLMLMTFFGVNVPDANAPFRLMRTDVLRKYLTPIPDDYEIPNIILTAFFARNNEKMTFREISFKARGAGVNSIDMKKIVKIGRKAVSDFRYFQKVMRK